MTKGAALQQFFGQFMTAYPSNAVPKDAVLPYLTYDAVIPCSSTANGDTQPRPAFTMAAPTT